MSTLASPLPLVRHISTPVFCNFCQRKIGHLIYKCGGIDRRTIEKFEKVGITSSRCSAIPFFLVGHRMTAPPSDGENDSYH